MKITIEPNGVRSALALEDLQSKLRRLVNETKPSRSEALAQELQRFAQSFANAAWRADLKSEDWKKEHRP